MNSATTTKLLTVSVTTATVMIMATAIIIVTAFMSSSSTMSIQKASAQMMAQSPPVGRMGPGMMRHGTMMGNLGMMGGLMMMGNRNFTGMMNPGMMMAAPNVTGSVPIFPTISKAIASQVHTSLVNATMTAEKTVGSNAHAVMSHLGIENGFLVYTICTIDSNNNIHRVIVDAGNGKVLSSQQLPIRPGMMMGPILPSTIKPNANNSSSMMTMTNMMKRGNIAMGFDQTKIAHHFMATPTGGQIMITALNSSDIQTINQIKNHIKEIQKEFSEGNFTKPFFIHAQQVPGTKIMSEKKDLIRYNILEMSNGSALILTTNDKELINAIRQFMEFQGTEHHGH